MTALLVAGAAGLLASLLCTPLLIVWLRSRGIGQHIRTDGPQRHLSKAGTPTMGGIAILFAGAAGYGLAHVVPQEIFTERGIIALVVLGLVGVVGFLDDWIKITRRRSLGLNKRAKAGGQLAVALGFAIVMVYLVGVNTHLSFISDSVGIQLGDVGWIIFAVLVIIGTSNAVNLTDGLDGLAAGSSAFTLVTFTIIGFYEFKHARIFHNPAALDEAVLAAALAGACAGFLWWNAAPARIFMGDTGALGLGAGMAVLALLENIDLLLPVIGGLFVLETLSVIIQVASFRLFHRRVFRMAPIHHHFELLGWPETTVIIRFWILGAAFTSVALGAFYADFLARGGVG